MNPLQGGEARKRGARNWKGRKKDFDGGGQKGKKGSRNQKKAG